jgi:predicted NAD/FAD-dependent oxidoreductase
VKLVKDIIKFTGKDSPITMIVSQQQKGIDIPGETMSIQFNSAVVNPETASVQDLKTIADKFFQNYLTSDEMNYYNADSVRMYRRLWRYAFPTRAINVPFVLDTSLGLPIYFGGEFCNPYGYDNIEAAFHSGNTIANNIIQAYQSKMKTEE